MTKKIQYVFSMTQESAIIFDLGNVLVSIDNTKALDAFLPFVKKTKDKKQIEQILYPSPALVGWSGTVIGDLHTGKISVRTFYNLVKQKLQFSRGMTFKRFSSIWPDRLMLKDDVAALLPRLKVSHRYILSDTNQLDADWLTKRYSSFFVQFQGLFFSHDQHVDKYSHRAWQNIMNVSKLPPKHHVFIDDRPDHVGRAKELGMYGIIYTDTATLIKNLTSEGLLERNLVLISDKKDKSDLVTKAVRDCTVNRET